MNQSVCCEKLQNKTITWWWYLIVIFPQTISCLKTLNRTRRSRRLSRLTDPKKVIRYPCGLQKWVCDCDPKREGSASNTRGEYISICHFMFRVIFCCSIKCESPCFLSKFPGIHQPNKKLYEQNLTIIIHFLPIKLNFFQKYVEVCLLKLKLCI